jgi:hypothetical protein
MTEPRPHTESELIELMRSIDVRAPDALHARVGALVAERPHAQARTRIGWAGTRGIRLGGGIAAVAALTAVLVFVLSSGGSATLDIRQVSSPTLRPATMTAPPESASGHGTLAEAVDGVAFPYWGEHFGWRASGARSDEIDGRAVTTVFYSDARGQRIGYAIVAGTQTPARIGGTVVWRAGTPFRLLTLHDAPAIAWLRAGHLCVMAGRGVSSATLLQLASWRERGSPA